MKFSGWLIIFLATYTCFSQTTIDQLLEAGLDDAKLFSKGYFNAASEGAINSISNGWYATAETKNFLEFDIAFVGNISFIRDDKKSFLLNENNYNTISFAGVDSRRLVTNAFGNNSTDINVIVNDEAGNIFELTLPNGLYESDINLIPTTYLQGSMGLIKGLEVKFRFMPKLKNGESTKTKIAGAAIQSDISQWVYHLRRWPVTVSAIIGYSSLKAEYDLSSTSSLEGNNQEIAMLSNSWLFSSIISTKREKLNFYGGFGFFAGSSRTDLNGTYLISRGTLAGSELENPLSVDNKESGLKVTLGSSFTYKFLRANLDFTLQNYNNLSFGVAFQI